MFTLQKVKKVYPNKGCDVTAIKDISCADIGALFVSKRFPRLVGNVKDSANRTAANHCLGAVTHVLEHYRCLAVPALQGTATVCCASIKHVLAVTFSGPIPLV